MRFPVFNLQLDVSMGQSITGFAEQRKPFLHHVLREGSGYPFLGLFFSLLPVVLPLFYLLLVIFPFQIVQVWLKVFQILFI